MRVKAWQVVETGLGGVIWPKRETTSNTSQGIVQQVVAENPEGMWASLTSMTRNHLKIMDRD